MDVATQPNSLPLVYRFVLPLSLIGQVLTKEKFIEYRHKRLDDVVAGCCQRQHGMVFLRGLDN